MPDARLENFKIMTMEVVSVSPDASIVEAVRLMLQNRISGLPVGPPNRYEEVAAHPRATLWACRSCVDARGLAPSSLDHRIKIGGMNECHAIAEQFDTKIIGF
jgi:sulfur relay (sulfurtransferase) complex TusBCD TusD component (DsrE family)